MRTKIFIWALTLAGLAASWWLWGQEFVHWGTSNWLRGSYYQLAFPGFSLVCVVSILGMLLGSAFKKIMASGTALLASAVMLAHLQGVAVQLPFPIERLGLVAGVLYVVIGLVRKPTFTPRPRRTQSDDDGYEWVSVEKPNPDYEEWKNTDATYLWYDGHTSYVQRPAPPKTITQLVLLPKKR